MNQSLSHYTELKQIRSASHIYTPNGFKIAVCAPLGKLLYLFVLVTLVTGYESKVKINNTASKQD